MAYFYPPIPPADIPGSELKVWNAFKSLPDDWHVFHSVAWQSIRGGHQGDGEADFLLMNETRGIIVLEVKGGGISIEQGRWKSTNKQGTYEIKDPFRQATASKYALLHYLKHLAPELAHINIGHAVAFPDINLTDGIGLGGTREIILDNSDLLTSYASISRITKHWQMKCSLTEAESARLKRVLAPTIIVKRTLKQVINDAQIQLLQLTTQQIGVLRSLRMVRRAIILGGAGTGKTILALEKAKHFESEGLKVLLTCFNTELGKHIRTQTNGSKIRAANFHALCFEEARKARINLPSNPPPDWWETQAPDFLVESAAVNQTTFDAIIVDEGQDFTPQWMQALHLLVRDQSEYGFYVFADTHQDLYARGAAMPKEWPRFILDLNCRNTRQIDQRVSAIYSDTAVTSAAHGPEPVFKVTDVKKQGVDRIQGLVSSLLTKDRLTADQIVVLSDDSVLLSQLRETGVNDHVFCELGAIGVSTETISRFKGLESDVIVLALSDQVVVSTFLRSLVYVALSRAKVVLYVLGSERIRAALGWQ